MNDLKMSKTQKKLESELKQQSKRNSLNNIEEKHNVYVYNNFYDFYIDVYYHCRPLKNINIELYNLITDKLIKNAISHYDEEIKIQNLKNIINEHILDLKNINNNYFITIN